MSLLPGPTGLAEIRDDILTDVLLEADNAGLTVSVGPGSEDYVWATGMAGALMLAHARISSVEDALTPLNATGADLVRFQRARRLPDVGASPGAGKIVLEVSGTDTVADGTVFTLPNGSRGHVVGNWSGVVDRDEVDVLMDDTGRASNAPPGTTVTFLNPPANVSPEATVSSIEPITGGFDAETEARLRERILNGYGNVPGGGNWGHLREIAFNASPAVQMAFVYPAIGGPSTAKTVITQAFDRENYDYSRAISSAAVQIVRDAVHATVSTGFSFPVTTPADQTVDVAVKFTIPDSTLSGGSGEGWTDITPWPQLVSATRVTVTSVTTAGVVTCDADTATAPVNGQTRVAWWSTNDMRFHTRTVTANSGSAGAWVLTLDAPFVDSRGLTPAAGDYLSPGAEHLIEYGETWLKMLETLGPGENTSDSSLIGNGRALRKPTEASGGPASDLNITQLLGFKSAHPEIKDLAWSYRSASAPTVPASVDDAPNILAPAKFGVYKQ
jgi:uncharacterized phage protein gp47/JayE